MKTISINNASVHVLMYDWSVHGLVSLALGSEEFSIEHEQEADYGRLNILTLNDGYYAHVREIDEHQIEAEELGDRVGLALIKTVDENYRDRDGDDVVRYWKVEVFDEYENKSTRVFFLDTACETTRYGTVVGTDESVDNAIDRLLAEHETMCGDEIGNIERRGWVSDFNSTCDAWTFQVVTTKLDDEFPSQKELYDHSTTETACFLVVRMQRDITSAA